MRGTTSNVPLSNNQAISCRDKRRRVVTPVHVHAIPVHDDHMTISMAFSVHYTISMNKNHLSSTELLKTILKTNLCE